MAEPVLEFFYQVIIGGVEIDEFRYSMIQSLTFREVSSGSDLLTINLEDPDFIFLEDRIFVEDLPIKVVMGFKNNYLTFDGYISVIDVSFPSSGSATLTLHCMDNSHILNRVVRKKTWANLRHSDIAQKIFAENGLKAKIDPTVTKEESVAQNDYDIKFLEGLADSEVTPYAVYVQGNTGYFVKKNIVATPQAELDYRAGKMNVISFSPRINKESLPQETAVSDVNIYDQKVDKAKTSSSTPRTVAGSDKWVNNRKTTTTATKTGGGIKTSSAMSQ